jgi:catechol 2,3-dioxygenase-like lactoylglutathione lyase family enzyme
MIENMTHVMLFFKDYNEALDFYTNKLHSKTNSYRFKDKNLFWDELIFKLILFRQQAYSQKYMSRSRL